MNHIIRNCDCALGFQHDLGGGGVNPFVFLILNAYMMLCWFPAHWLALGFSSAAFAVTRVAWSSAAPHHPMLTLATAARRSRRFTIGAQTASGAASATLRFFACASPTELQCAPRAVAIVVSNGATAPLPLQVDISALKHKRAPRPRCHGKPGVTATSQDGEAQMVCARSRGTGVSASCPLGAT
eukprot:2099960-Pyramimonas_sp.AAC.2